MVTTRHKKAIESGQPPPTRKLYKEVSDEELSERSGEYDESPPKKIKKGGEKGKKGGSSGAAAGGKKRGRPGKKKAAAGPASTELQHEEQSPLESEEEAKIMRTAEEKAPEQPQLEQLQQGEEPDFLAGQQPFFALPEWQQPAEPETQDMDELAKYVFQEEEDEPTQPEQEAAPLGTAAPSFVPETEPPAEEQQPQQSQKQEEEQPKSEEEAPPPQTTTTATTTTTTTANIKGVVEQGRLFFFYRPKVEMEEASSLDEVQRFYMIFAPQEGSGRKPRLAIIGKKRLPKVSAHERFFGFIDSVGDSLEALTAKLGPKTYKTKTRGTRHVAAARAVGEATYAIVNRGGSGAAKTDLVLKVLVPQQPGEVQEDFAIPQEGLYGFSIKNPSNEPGSAQGEAPGGSGSGSGGGQAIGLEEKADFPEEKCKEFGNYAWIGVTDPTLLEYERCEFLLVAATEDVQGELGAAAQELTGDSDVCAESDEERLLAEMKKEIGMEDVGVEMQPVETGEWK